MRSCLVPAHCEFQVWVGTSPAACFGAPSLLRCCHLWGIMVLSSVPSTVIDIEKVFSKCLSNKLLPSVLNGYFMQQTWRWSVFWGMFTGQALYVHVVCNTLKISILLAWVLRAGSRRYMSIKKQSSIALNALGSTVPASACVHLHPLRRLPPSLRDRQGPSERP